jgi:serine/threonine protein phosphatase PrpC
MEDAHCAELDVDGTSASFFGVYDGHGGMHFLLPKKKGHYSTL